jgi:hypothetical protein
MIRQFFWLCVIACLAFPVSQWHREVCSALQRRDRIGIAPISLLGNNAPDHLY